MTPPTTSEFVAGCQPSRRPTVLEPRPDLGAALARRVLLKREDLYDDIGSGHKARKLEWVVAAARAANADVLVTAGSEPSSQCVAVAAAAAKAGLDCHLVYCGDVQERPVRANGSYLLAMLHRPRVTWHERVPWREVDRLLDLAAAEEMAAGRRPFVIPPGIATTAGLRGSTALGVELAGQLAEHGLADVPVHLVVPGGTGTTALGIAVTSAAARQPWQLHAVSVARVAADVAEQVDSLRQRVEDETGTRLEAAPISFCETPGNYPYDQPDAEALERMVALLQTHHLLLDPNYMLPAFRGLERLIADEVIPPSEPVVLVHTGGTFGVFGAAPALTQWLAATG